jgi:O-antigen/teichoic acid export membrane protein
LRLRFIKNAISNLGRGGAGAVLAILLPPVLVRHMQPAAYAVWVLILQVVAYLGYLDFGLQTAVGRYIAFAIEKKDTKLGDGIYSTAFAGLTIATLLGLALILVAAMALPLIFPSVPKALLAPMRTAILIVGTSVALGLPTSAWNGVFVGMQRYEIPAITIGTGKLLSAIGLTWAVLSGKSLVFMACVVASMNLLSYLLQFGMLRRVAPQIGLTRELITKSTILELSDYCLSLTVWSFSMLLVSGLDVVLVGRFQFSAIAPYSVSATLMAVLGGIQFSIFGVIMPHAAGLQAREGADALGDLLVRSTKLGFLMLLVTGLPLIVFAAPVIRIWIGPQYSNIGGHILVILVIANILRLIGAPYGSILIGAGQQKLVVFSPLMEGVTNLAASVALGLKYGAIGVAYGTLLGGMVGLLAHLIYNIPRTSNTIAMSPYRLMREGLMPPAICGIPAIVALLLSYHGSIIATRVLLPCLMVSCTGCAVLIGGSVGKRRSLRPTISRPPCEGKA